MPNICGLVQTRYCPVAVRTKTDLFDSKYLWISANSLFPVVDRSLTDLFNYFWIAVNISFSPKVFSLPLHIINIYSFFILQSAHLVKVELSACKIFDILFRR
jgi:hypothetical protein